MVNLFNWQIRQVMIEIWIVIKSLQYLHNFAEVPELTSQPRVTVEFEKENKTSTFMCKFDKLPRADVKYLIDWSVDDVIVRSEVTTMDESELTEDLYGDGGYGVKVRTCLSIFTS